MALLGLREAARQAGVNRTTLLRAVRAGKLSASRAESGGWLIEPAELFRAYPPTPEPEPVRTPSAPECEDRNAQPVFEPGTPDALESRVRIARLEAQLEAAAEKQRLLEDALAETRVERDRWAAQAERLALAPPTAAPPPTKEPPLDRGASVPVIVQRRSWWRRLAG